MGQMISPIMLDQAVTPIGAPRFASASICARICALQWRTETARSAMRCRSARNSRNTPPPVLDGIEQDRSRPCANFGWLVFGIFERRAAGPAAFQPCLGVRQRSARRLPLRRPRLLQLLQPREIGGHLVEMLLRGDDARIIGLRPEAKILRMMRSSRFSAFCGGDLSMRRFADLFELAG